MSEKINISKLDKAEVLAALHNASKQQGMGFLNPLGDVGITVEEARTIIGDRKELSFDYLRGRVMKVDISKDELHPGLYDRDNGQGAAAKALEPLLAAVSS